MRKRRGFSLIELLVVISIIGIISSIIFVSLGTARTKARDIKRKSDLASLGRFLYSSACYLPTAGAGDYDIIDMFVELAASNPQYAQYANFVPKDPKSGTSVQSNYRYQVDTAGHCVVYANLENEDEPITLSITNPAPNSSLGVLQGQSVGVNGTYIYYQISK